MTDAPVDEPTDVEIVADILDMPHRTVRVRST